MKLTQSEIDLLKSELDQAKLDQEKRERARDRKVLFLTGAALAVADIFLFAALMSSPCWWLGGAAFSSFPLAGFCLGASTTDATGCPFSCLPFNL